MVDYRNGAPPVLRDYLTYIETIRGKSKKTADEYFLDLRSFFRFMLLRRGAVASDAEFDEIDISGIDVVLLRSVTLSDLYEYLGYLSRQRPVHANSKSSEIGLGAAARARKVASLRSFFKYLTSKAHVLDENPAAELESPKQKKTLPRHLSLEESMRLLNSVEGNNAERNYCILTLFLNCGLRVSELVGIDLSDISEETLRVTGKGNKERIIYLNDACREAVDAWLTVRPRTGLPPKHRNAMFISREHNRINAQTVKWLVKKHLAEAGIDPEKYSAHKLRHTAATLMYQNGVDIRTLQEVLGHENLDTTKIYTHTSSEQMRMAAQSNPLAGQIKRRRPAKKHE